MVEHETDQKSAWIVLLRILLKAGVLFVLFNVVYALLNPLPLLGQVSVYNWLVPGRERLPFGESSESYNLSLFQLDTMFASHKVAQPKQADEFRVLVIGDSSVWGTLLHPEETLAGQLNAGEYVTAGGLHVRAYNLGYPTISVMKDLLVLSEVMDAEPDMIVWLTTLEALPRSKQLTSPIVQHNPEPVQALIEAYDLDLDVQDAGFVDPTFMERTIIGERRALADVIRLNLYGVMWAGTGIDQVYPDDYTLRAEDLEANTDFYDLESPLTADDLALDVIAAGMELVGDTPVLLVNEPMFVSSGENSDIRYNFYYPRWAYDEYRVLLNEQAENAGWWYLDAWDAIPNTEYTNSAIHLTPAGSAEFASIIGAVISE